MSYSTEFKDAIVTKLINRGDTTFAEVCVKEGVTKSTAYTWLNRGTIPDMKNKIKAKKWSAKDKLQAVSHTISSSEAEIGLYLRKEGLHSQQLNDWRTQVLEALETTSKRSVTKDSRENLIKDLQSELLRKDRALAEASALLILQKKVSLSWGDEAQK